MAYIQQPLEGPQFKWAGRPHPGRPCFVVEAVEMRPGEPVMFERYCSSCGHIRVREPLEQRRASMSREGWVRL
jgi:hypothetical protein